MAMSTRASRSFNVMLASRSLGIVTVISTMKVAQKAKFGKPPDFGVAVIFLWQRQIEKRWPTMRKKANVRTAFSSVFPPPCAGHHAARKSSGADTKTDTKRLKKDMTGLSTYCLNQQ